MKLTVSFSLFLFTLFIFGEESFSLSDYQIKKFCLNKQREATCIKTFKEKRSKLRKGQLIEIPVIPYKK